MLVASLIALLAGVGAVVTGTVVLLRANRGRILRAQATMFDPTAVRSRAYAWSTGAGVALFWLGVVGLMIQQGWSSRGLLLFLVPFWLVSAPVVVHNFRIIRRRGLPSG
jgi:hypothetical protein